MNMVMRILWVSLFSILVLVQPGASARAQSGDGGEEGMETQQGNQAVSGQGDVDQLLKQADDLIDKGERQTGAEQIGTYKSALEILDQAVTKQPDNFAANWKTAEACRLYGEQAREQKIANWEDVCAEYGKKGMHYAERAIDLEPDKVQGYYYYGLCTGTYSDGVGLFTALREGLKNKVQKNLETAFQIDKSYDDGGPMVALGRFWQVVPWPYTDEDKAMKYYREFQNTPYFDNPDRVEAHVYMAEILVDERGKKPKAEARQLLTQALEISKDPYWTERAQTLMKEL